MTFPNLTLPTRSWPAAVLLLAACGGHAAPSQPMTDPGAAYRLLATLSDDSLAGRATGRPGAVSAARIIAEEMRGAGLTPAGDSGFHQRVPLVMASRTFRNGGQERTVRGPMVAASFAARDSFPAADRLPGSNVVGLIAGADPALADEYVLIGAHYDHVGIRAPVNGDSIYNGADDDASGVVAVLEIARQIARGPRPRRTLVFATWIGEESGLLGARWFSDHPVRPLDQMVANLEIEMIGRPDSLAGGPGRAWLTGYERSTMGEALAAAGLPIGPDRRPAQNFFRRSDNYQFALKGIVAHTLSTFNMHEDYHRPSDEISRVDRDHFARVIDAAAAAVRILADGPKPEWKPGGRPTPQP
ncbi:MAG: M20/M25/M40 family metallo-hydrolase [Gemmatimonadales bacterium]